MNHKSHSGNTAISTGNTDTPIGLVIKFPYKKEGYANAEASIGCISLQFTYTHPNCTHMHTSAVFSHPL